MSRVLLLDADITAFEVCLDTQDRVVFGDEEEFLNTDPKLAYEKADLWIADLMEKTDCDEVMVVLSHKDRYRPILYPRYKANRKNTKRPPFLPAMRDYITTEYKAVAFPWLEGDDVIAYYATHPRYKDRCVVASIDKDMQTIPNAHIYNWRKDVWFHTTLTTANRYLCIQTVIGDTADGYPGCRGIGPKSKWVQQLMEATTPAEMWGTVIQAYDSKGKTEEDAILQARMAYLLRYRDVNPLAEGLFQYRLWTPERLTDDY